MGRHMAVQPQPQRRAVLGVQARLHSLQPPLRPLYHLYHCIWCFCCQLSTCALCELGWATSASAEQVLNE